MRVLHSYHQQVGLGSQVPTGYEPWRQCDINGTIITNTDDGDEITQLNHTDRQSNDLVEGKLQFLDDDDNDDNNDKDSNTATTIMMYVYKVATTLLQRRA